MATNLDLDPELIEQAQALGCHKTKKAAVTAALEEYVRACLRKQFLELMGTIDYDPAYDYKEARRRDLERIPSWE